MPRVSTRGAGRTRRLIRSTIVSIRSVLQNAHQLDICVMKVVVENCFEQLRECLTIEAITRSVEAIEGASDHTVEQSREDRSSRTQTIALVVDICYGLQTESDSLAMLLNQWDDPTRSKLMLYPLMTARCDPANVTLCEHLLICMLSSKFYHDFDVLCSWFWHHLMPCTLGRSWPSVLRPGPDRVCRARA